MESFEQFVSSPPVIEGLAWKKIVAGDLATSLSEGHRHHGQHDGVSFFFARWQHDGLFLKFGPDSDVVLPGKRRGDEIDTKFRDDFWIIDPTGFTTHWQDPFAEVRETRVQPSRVFRHRVADFCQVINMGIMYLQPGAVKWEHDTFSTIGYIAELGDAVRITGQLRRDSEGRAEKMDVQYNTRDASYQYLLRYSYATNIGLPFLPSTIEAILIRPGVQTKLMELGLLSIKTSTRSLDPSLFRPGLHKPNMPVAYYTNGTWYMTNVLGRLAPIPGPVAATSLMQAEREGFKRNQIYYGVVILNTIVTFSLVRRMTTETKTKNEKKGNLCVTS